jgi:8-oxo-dGTP pyrophosphatase MutT (NUDIX family)
MVREFHFFCDTVRRALDREQVAIVRPDLVRAAVLVPIVWREGEAFVLFTQRTMSVARHKGQISFPGGAAEREDADAVATALREAQEEIGLDPGLVEIVGVLPDGVTSTGFVVTPVVGFVDAKAPYAADPAEVAEVFELSFTRLADPAVHKVEIIDDDGRSYVNHSYTVDGRRVWGVTGRILASLFDSLAEMGALAPWRASGSGLAP